LYKIRSNPVLEDVKVCSLSFEPPVSRLSAVIGFGTYFNYMGQCQGKGRFGGIGIMIGLAKCARNIEIEGRKSIRWDGPTASGYG
jgi:hypothetical protein